MVWFERMPSIVSNNVFFEIINFSYWCYYSSFKSRENLYDKNVPGKFLEHHWEKNKFDGLLSIGQLILPASDEILSTVPTDIEDVYPEIIPLIFILGTLCVLKRIPWRWIFSQEVEPISHWNSALSDLPSGRQPASFGNLCDCSIT